MSSAKVQVVMHDNHGGWRGRPMPGLSLEVQPFFGYVLGNPDVRASGQSEGEVLERLKESLLMAVESDRHVTRKIVELDLGDHIVVADVMNG